MTQDHNEGAPEAPVVSKETQDTLDYFKAQGNEIDEPAKTEDKPEIKADEPTTPEKPEEKPEAKKEESSDDGKESEKPNRTPKVIPAWQHEIEVKRLKQEHARELADAKNSNQEAKKPDEAVNVPTNKAIEDVIRERADELGVDPDTLKAIIDLAKPEIPQEFKEAAKELNELKKQRLEAQEEAGFEKEFSSIMTDIKSEYGETLTDSQLSEIKGKLKDLAFQEAYAKTPLSVLFKGIDDFRNTKVIKRTMESSRPAANTAADMDFSNMTDEDLASAPRETQQKYFEWSDKKNGKR